MEIIEENNHPKNLRRIWEIQAATWRDFTQLHYLEKSCFKPDDLWPFWDLIGILSLPGLVRLKAVSDDRMVGFIGGERKAATRMGWVTNLAVLPGYRRRGIASALLEECEEAFIDMKSIRLSVRASNQAAIHLYQNAHYRLVDRWNRYYAGGEDALVFEKSR